MTRRASPSLTLCTRKRYHAQSERGRQCDIAGACLFRVILRVPDGLWARQKSLRNTILSEPIGLDGRSRGKLAAYASVANKGSWLDSHTFVLERPFLGNGEMSTGRFSLTVTS